MGRKAGGLYINPKKFGSLRKPCMKEMITFLNCLALNHNNDEKCIRQKELLNACMDAQVIALDLPIAGNPGEALIIICKGLTGEGSNTIVQRNVFRKIIASRGSWGIAPGARNNFSCFTSSIPRVLDKFGVD